MKKSTILIITAVFLISVFVVGIFGLQNVPYEECVYIEKITPTTITFDSNEGTIEKNVYYTEEDGGYYYVTIPNKNFHKGMLIWVNYDLSPSNASNKQLRITKDDTLGENPICEILDDGAVIKINDVGMVNLFYEAQDQKGGAKMTLQIRIKES